MESSQTRNVWSRQVERFVLTGQWKSSKFSDPFGVGSFGCSFPGTPCLATLRLRLRHESTIQLSNNPIICVASLRHLPPRAFGDKTTTMSDLNSELVRAVELALAGDWDAAHQIVQQYEDNATASGIHAVLHKMEGDLGNSRYWYNRAGRLDHVLGEDRQPL